jgi:hypothetical protein
MDMECSGGGLDYLTWFWIGCAVAVSVSIAAFAIWRCRDK